MTRRLSGGVVFPPAVRLMLFCPPFDAQTPYDRCPFAMRLMPFRLVEVVFLCNVLIVSRLQFMPCAMSSAAQMQCACAFILSTKIW